jgi:hypothetical protein
MAIEISPGFGQLANPGDPLQPHCALCASNRAALSQGAASGLDAATAFGRPAGKKKLNEINGRR